jgi:CubicO group peptidase (beta-lactamase class C family)
MGYELIGRRQALAMMAGGAALAAAPSAFAQASQPFHPDATKLLFWEGDEQIWAFRNMDKIYATRPFVHGPNVHPLPAAASPLDIRFDVDGKSWDTASMMEHNRNVGIVVVKDGQVVLERYAFGHDAKAKWTSFSMAKSLTSTLMGAAIQDKHIGAVTDLVTKYLPSLKGSAFDGAIIRDLLRMSGGDVFSENYLDANSDVNQHIAIMANKHRKGAMLAQMATLPRRYPPGMINTYNTGEAYLLGEIVAAAIGGPLSPYVTEKIWKPYGMESDGYWMLSAEGGTEWGGGCYSATSRDYARFGQFILGNGMAGGRQVLPEWWVKEATTASAPSGPNNAPVAYGYQWWVLPNGAYRATGVFGQTIVVNPKLNLVVTIQSAYQKVSGARENGQLASAFLAAVTAKYA